MFINAWQTPHLLIELCLQNNPGAVSIADVPMVLSAVEVGGRFESCRNFQNRKFPLKQAQVFPNGIQYPPALAQRGEPTRPPCLVTMSQQFPVRLILIQYLCLRHSVMSIRDATITNSVNIARTCLEDAISRNKNVRTFCKKENKNEIAESVNFVDFATSTKRLLLL